MKKLLFVHLALAVAGGVALEASAKTVAERMADKAAKDAAEYRENGGMVKRPGEQEGRIVFANAQRRVSTEVIRFCAENLEEEFHFQIDTESGSFDVLAPKIVGNATLYVIDDGRLPTLLVAPEERWASVNVAKIAKDGLDKDAFEMRVTKEISRGFALLGGGFLSQFNRTLTECITDHRTLDDYPDWRLPFDTIQKIRKYLPGYGIKAYEPATYRDACYEGWASVPKDEVQKRILAEETESRRKDDAEKKK